MTILWWHWLVLGLVLALAELAAAGGFYIIFFGIAAIIMGLLASVGLAGPTWVQILLYTILSIGSLVLFRTRLLGWLQVDPQAPAVDTLIGEIAVAAEDVAPGSIGRVELRGSAWTARNAAAVPLLRGARCRVIRVDGLTVSVEPEGART
jgi:membrane protein implicated in regulation of membrane protease activity